MYALAVGLETLLFARKFPVPVKYGPERFGRGGPAFVIVVERDPAASDRVSAPVGASRNPPQRGTRRLAVRLTIWAKSELTGARRCEHEDLCEQIVDAVLVALDEWMRAHSHHTGAMGEVTEARYVEPAELGAQEAYPGVVFMLRLAVPRGVQAVDALGTGLPEGTVAATTFQVRIARNASQDPPETIP